MTLPSLASVHIPIDDQLLFRKIISDLTETSHAFGWGRNKKATAAMLVPHILTRAVSEAYVLDAKHGKRNSQSPRLHSWLITRHGSIIDLFPGEYRDVFVPELALILPKNSYSWIPRLESIRNYGLVIGQDENSRKAVDTLVRALKKRSR